MFRAACFARAMRVPFALLLIAVAAGAAPSPSRIDWQAVAEENVVRIVTHDADGSTRETKIWIVVVDGQAYIRTGSTRWYANLERDPSALLRVPDADHPIRTKLISDGKLVDRIEAAYREKYGFWDRSAGWVRLGETHIMQLVAPIGP